MPLTCLGSGDSLGGGRVTGLLSSPGDWLQTSPVWRGPSGQDKEKLLLCQEQGTPALGLEGRALLSQAVQRESWEVTFLFSFGYAKCSTPALGFWISVLEGLALLALPILPSSHITSWF